MTFTRARAVLASASLAALTATAPGITQATQDTDLSRATTVVDSIAAQHTSHAAGFFDGLDAAGADFTPAQARTREWIETRRAEALGSLGPKDRARMDSIRVASVDAGADLRLSPGIVTSYAQGVLAADANLQRMANGLTGFLEGHGITSTHADTITARVIHAEGLAPENEARDGLDVMADAGTPRAAMAEIEPHFSEIRWRAAAPTLTTHTMVSERMVGEGYLSDRHAADAAQAVASHPRPSDITDLFARLPSQKAHRDPSSPYAPAVSMRPAKRPTVSIDEARVDTAASSSRLARVRARAEEKAKQIETSRASRVHGDPDLS